MTMLRPRSAEPTRPSKNREGPFLSVEDLSVRFPTEDGLVSAVEGVSLSVSRGKTLAVVGESGSGKSVTALAIMGLLNRKSAKVTGEVWLDGEELVAAAGRRASGSCAATRWP